MQKRWSKKRSPTLKKKNLQIEGDGTEEEEKAIGIIIKVRKIIEMSFSYLSTD